MAKLTDAELAALDLIIEAKKAGMLPGGFVKAIANAAGDIANAAVKIAGAVAVLKAVANAEGGRVAVGDVARTAPAGIQDFSVEDLIRVRNELAKE